MPANSGAQPETMKRRPRRLTRREKWPLHVGLFLLYVLIQMITSVYTSNMGVLERTPIESPSLQSSIEGQDEVVNGERAPLKKTREEAGHIGEMRKRNHDAEAEASSKKDKQVPKEGKENREKAENKDGSKEVDGGDKTASKDNLHMFSGLAHAINAAGMGNRKGAPKDSPKSETEESKEGKDNKGEKDDKGEAKEVEGGDKGHVHTLSMINHAINKIRGSGAGTSKENTPSPETKDAKERQKAGAGTEGDKEHLNLFTGIKHQMDVIGSISPPETTTPRVDDERVTLRPRRNDCFPPAIEQFPRPLMRPEARSHGGLIIHILVALYTFFGLAIVCDDYFVSSLDRICEELRLSPDVAGATFMAAGSSAPELATVIIGVFFAEDDIGVSGVIGSAAFNIMFVISVCGLCSGTVSKLNWWPLCRDCFFYAISILVMLGTIYNESISWMESLFMLVMYGVYCVALYYNSSLERWAKSLNLPYLPKDDEPAEESALVSYRSLQEERLSYTGPNSPNTDQIKSQNQEGYGMQEYNDPACPKPAAPRPAQPEYYKAKAADPNEVSPLVRPTDGGKWRIFSWGLMYPIHFMCRATMPDCRQEKWKAWYPFTFCVSMIWISFYSYFMVWMITIIGSTLGIPDTVMGLTFVAAGVSVPDALSSLSVIKEGLGDMAVSNAVGSNVFDILVCLGLPWFIQTAMISPGSHVNVTSRGLTYSTLSLLSTVFLLVFATHMNGWKLDRRYGVVLMILYLIFITFASLYELNIFGDMNPISCPTDY